MLKYPIDEEGFAIPSDEWKEDMLHYGLIVVPILTEEEIIKSQEALWKHMSLYSSGKITSDYKTWETENWPQPETPFLSTDYAVDEQAFRNRLHQRLVEVFQTLYRTKDLLTTIDFYGIKRATLFPDGERKDWRTKALRLHWDVDISSYVKEGKARYQALIALNDNAENGSFSCVPGSHKLLEELDSQTKICLDKPLIPENGKYVPEGHPLQKLIQRIPIRQGHVVIWDMGLAHANYENISTQPRLTQYVRMLPNSPYYIEREGQCIVHYWKSHSKCREEVLKWKWTKQELRILGLRK